MAKRASKLKVKKKRWYSLISPDFLNHKPVAELLSDDISKLVGKKVTINLMQVTKDFHHQDSAIMLKIVGTSGQTLKSKFLRLSTSLSSIKRNARRRRDRIDLKTEIKTKDDVSAYIKVVLITQRNTTRLIRSEIQKVAIAFLKEIAKTRTFTMIANDAIRNKLQREMVPKVKKIYPVKSIIVREYGIKEGDIESDLDEETPEKITEEQEKAEISKEEEVKEDVSKEKEVKEEGSKEEKVVTEKPKTVESEDLKEKVTL